MPPTACARPQVERAAGPDAVLERGSDGGVMIKKGVELFREVSEELRSVCLKDSCRAVSNTKNKKTGDYTHSS